jgi:hypothetical protein
METNTETLYIYFFQWVAVPTSSGRENETVIECSSYANVLELIASDEENMGYTPALRIHRAPREYGSDMQTARENNALDEAFAFAKGDQLPEQVRVEHRHPAVRLFLEVPVRYRREVAACGWTTTA